MRELSSEEYRQNIEENKHIFYDKYDSKFTESLAKNVMGIVDKVFFRSVFIGFDEPIERNTPNHPVILASNHSGMAFPWDAMVFGAGLFKKMDWDDRKVCRVLASPVLSQTAIMTPYLIKDLWKKIGGVDATYANFETMLHYPDSNIMIYPEGIGGIGKGWNRRYQLQRFATSFIRMSLKYKTDIVPFATVNGENINPHTYSFDWINRLSSKIGIPFIPVGLLIVLLPFQPWLFYYAWPAKLTYVRGKRISPYEWTDKPYEEISDEEVREFRDRVQVQMQEELDAAVAKYGRRPYRMGEHLRSVWKNRKMFPFFFPWGWLFAFHEFIRLWNRREPKQTDVQIQYGFGSWFRMLWKNPFTIFYFIPILGWIPIIWLGYKGGIQEPPEKVRERDQAK